MKTLHKGGVIGLVMMVIICIVQGAGAETIKRKDFSESFQPLGFAELNTGETEVEPKVKAGSVDRTGPVSGQDWTVGDLNLEMKWIAPGSFMMGSPSSEELRDDDEKKHRVHLTSGYWLGAHEVTQDQWQAVMGDNPSRFKGSGTLPVEKVSWDDSMEFCRKLTQRERQARRLPAGLAYTLPSETQWEYACRERGNATGPFHYGDSLSSSQANFDGGYPYPYGNRSKGIYRKKTVEVGSFSPNALGLFDMHGNVWEWCYDRYGAYPSGSVTDPVGSENDSLRVYRGGSWNFGGRFCRSATRYKYLPSHRRHNLGFRLSLQEER